MTDWIYLDKMVGENDASASAARFALRYDGERLFWAERVSKSVRAGMKAGSLHPNGYEYVRLGGRNFLSHRIIWLLVYGCWPSGHVDHINGSKSFNRIENLRDVGPLENAHNQKIPKNNSSGYAGVCWCKSTGKWLARIVVDRNRVNLGYFDDVHDAGAAKKAAEQKYDYHPNHGRAA